MIYRSGGSEYTRNRHLFMFPVRFCRDFDIPECAQYPRGTARDAFYRFLVKIRFAWRGTVYFNKTYSKNDIKKKKRWIYFAWWVASVVDGLNWECREYIGLLNLYTVRDDECNFVANGKRF